MADRILKLNVGGTLYTTTRYTLTSVPGSFLDRVATGDVPCLRDHRGTLFVDRDGHVFRHVLNFLRTGKLSVPQGYRELHLLRDEAAFYGLDDLVAEVDKMMRRRRRNKQPAHVPQRFDKLTSRSVDNLCDENGSVIFEDDSSDFFYD